MRRVARFFKHEIEMWRGYAARAVSGLIAVVTTDPVATRNQRKRNIDIKGRAAYCFRQAAIREGMWAHMTARWGGLEWKLDKMEFEEDFASYGFPPLSAHVLAECTRVVHDEELSLSDEESNGAGG
jgi:hypothetical protein